MNFFIDQIKYEEVRNILSGCRTISDAKYFCEYYNDKYPEMRNIIKSMIEGKMYSNILDIDNMFRICNLINVCDNMEDSVEIIKTNQKQLDDIQLSVLYKIASKKPNKPAINNADLVKVTKKCPHCGTETRLPEDTEYVVCGFNNSKIGYDWVGCKKDWCFRCGKMLCKSWYEDKLFNKINRLHNSECCKKHAKLTGRKYPDDYCQCEYSHKKKINLPNIISDLNVDMT
jgi:hypothetical protein